MMSLTQISARRPRALGLLVAAVVVVASSYAIAAMRPVGQTVDPPLREHASGSVRPSAIDDGGAPAGSLAQIDHSIEAWSKNLEGNSSDFLAATNLAALYQGRARISHDLADYERARTAARTAIAIEPSYAPARVLDAAILFSLHDFGGAYAAADELLGDDPAQVGALATRFDATIELGRIDDARADLDRLRPIGGPAVLIRAARLASVTGNPTLALQHAREARATAIKDDVDDVGFYAYAEGEYARLAGDAEIARDAFTDALDDRDNDLAALIGLARIDAFDGRIDAAIDGLRRATAIAPQPESLALLGDLLAARGDASATESYETVRFIERLGDIQAATFDRQLLLFELDHDGATDNLLARARDSVTARPDWSGRDTLAWALYRLGRFDEAADEIAAARALGADGARLRYHDGAIRLALGDATAGRERLQAALDLGPALDPLERSDALRLLAR